MQVYYVDSETQSSTWESPLLPFLGRTLETGRRYLEAPSEERFKACFWWRNGREDFFEEAKLQLWARLKAESALLD